MQKLEEPKKKIVEPETHDEDKLYFKCPDVGAYGKQKIEPAKNDKV